MLDAMRRNTKIILWVTIVAFVGLIVIIPVIGYAAWHGYLETIDADDFPRHELGITSVPRMPDGA